MRSWSSVNKLCNERCRFESATLVFLVVELATILARFGDAPSIRFPACCPCSFSRTFLLDNLRSIGYNGLVVAWPEIRKLASETRAATPQQPAMDME